MAHLAKPPKLTFPLPVPLPFSTYRYGVIAPAVIEAPKFFKSTAFQNPENVTQTPFQIVNNTDLPAFQWAHLNRPDLVAEFGLWMTALRGRTAWLDVLDFEALVNKGGVVVDAETPLFVDVGGGIGSQCALLKSKLPGLPGKVILQDLPIVIQHALPTPGVENMAHDFWGEQPVKGKFDFFFFCFLFLSFLWKSNDSTLSFFSPPFGL